MVAVAIILVCVFGFTMADIQNDPAEAFKCVCADVSNVLNVRNGPSTSNTVVGTLPNGHCRWTMGSKVSAGGHQWFSINFAESECSAYWTAGQTWTAGKFLVYANSAYSCNPGLCSHLTSRSGWNARPPADPTDITLLTQPVPNIYIHHTAGPSCNSASACEGVVRGIQNYHMDSKGWNDIGYNFLVGGDGNAYEGRGWYTQGAHTAGQNSFSYGISFMGTYTTVIPSNTTMCAAKKLISCALFFGDITSDYDLYGHRDAPGASTTCPGNGLYHQLDGTGPWATVWPHW